MTASFDPLDHLDASLQDFEPTTPPPFGYPSHHSGFNNSNSSSSHHHHLDDTESDQADSVSAGGYSPPAWRRLENGNRSSGFWRHSDNLLHKFSPTARIVSPGYESDDDRMFDDDDDDLGGQDDILARAIRTRLPSGSMSPDKGMSRSPEPDRTLKIDEIAMKSTSPGSVRETPNNYIRFALRAEVQQRTEPIDAAITFVQTKINTMTRSWKNIFASILVALLSIVSVRALFQPMAQPSVPDLVKVAGFARSFEPLIYFSENGVAHVGDLQATSVAVWDLGESVRSSNMTSADIIVKNLDELSESLKTLAIELTKFFANVDGDIDGILLVMDWARRELSHLPTRPSAPLGLAVDNIYALLTHAGILEHADGTPTTLGRLTTSLLGRSHTQRTRATLERTFNEFLSVLEESINSELQNSLALFALFEAIDQQFLNLARTVARESNHQEDAHADLLSSLWTRILGPNPAAALKFERNRRLLSEVRQRTVVNKGILLDHNSKLLTLKTNLELLRRRLVSPLVRSVNSSLLSVEDQIRGLEDVGTYLEEVRRRQKGRIMETLYGSPQRAIEADEKTIF